MFCKIHKILEVSYYKHKENWEVNLFLKTFPIFQPSKRGQHSSKKTPLSTGRETMATTRNYHCGTCLSTATNDRYEPVANKRQLNFCCGKVLLVCPQLQRASFTMPHKKSKAAQKRRRVKVVRKIKKDKDGLIDELQIRKGSFIPAGINGEDCVVYLPKLFSPESMARMAEYLDFQQCLQICKATAFHPLNGYRQHGHT